MGVAQPRFLGRALYDDGGGAALRHSVASQQTYPSSDRDGASAYTTDSIYNLNPGAQLYADGAYHDEPGFSNADQPVRRGSGKRAAYTNPKSRRRKILLGLAALIVLLAVIAAVLYFTVFKKKSSSSSGSSSAGDTSSSSSSSSGSSGSTPQVAIITGTDGSTIAAEDGSTFTYKNSFGGSWYWDINDPFNNGARAQSWTPALNETFNFGVDKVRGVNIGGWLVTEPVRCICPCFGITVVDEYILLQAGGQQALEDHYATFITEQDFMEIAAAGLNFVRIPVAYWAIEVLEGEGYLANVSWTYFLKAIQWARKYGLRINLDFHALPGSQNGWNHSGRLGSYNVLYGPMGIANAQRSLDYVRILAEFISQPEYVDVIPLFGVTNEPQGNNITQDILSSYYLQAYNNVRLASGIGAGKGPYVSFHDGFFGAANWAGFLPNADRASLDEHPYLCFQGQSADPITARTSQPCSSWGALFNATMSDFGFIVAGEWSNAVTDCGLYVNGVGQGTRYEGTFPGYSSALGNCTTDWLDWQNWDSTTKQAYMKFAQSSMDALQNWFFWTWKIGNSTAGIIEAPQWSYQLGLQQGWMPTDPRTAVGQCGNTNPWKGPLSAWQTGGVGAGTIPTATLNALSWPPASIVFSPGDVTSAASLLPTYTPSGTPITLPGPTFAPASGQPSATTTVTDGSGWANTADNAGMMKPVSGCSYYTPWIGYGVSPPSPLCTGAVRRTAGPAEAVVTAMVTLRAR
ncbi:glycoside hydrolase superfamily [Mycena galopus ATCC 62051]|nr:glycoside hydrolase superfamily [Mycena galopus ATCC 62051]